MSARRTTRLTAVAALAAALVTGPTGCTMTHGVDEGMERAIVSPRGDIQTFRISTTAAPGYYQERGELLEVRSGALLIALSSSIIHVPFDRMVRPEVTPGRIDLLHPRYPHGLTDTQLRRLLEAYGVPKVDTLESIGRREEAAAAGPADGPDPAVLEAFLEDAREAAAPYHSLEEAVAAGYRRLGPSFPGMGEHWIHPGLIVESRVDAARPPVLCYARIDGEPRLIALAYAVPLEADEPPPAFPAGRHIWHDHTDHVDEETLLLSHPGSHHGADGPRLAMFHAWLWLDNPEGPLAQNNWRLPFLEAGLDPAGIRPSDDAARGLSLFTTGTDYYLRLFSVAAEVDDTERERLRRIIEGRATHARAWAGNAAREGVNPAGLAELETLWTGLWTEIRQAVGPETYRSLAVLR